MNVLEAVILGIVEGLTEFLPISSTAHLVISSHFLQIPESTFLASFIIAIQLGAIASVVLVYWRTILFDLETGKRVAVAFIPTATAGFLLYQLLKEYLLESLVLIAWALLLGGIILILFEKFASLVPRSEQKFTYTRAFFIGCAQALAIIPGVSRAGATIIGGLALGLTREKIVEFSFLLAIPTMVAATGYDLLKSASSFSAGDWAPLAIGFVVSFAFAYIAVRWLIRYVQTHTFTIFGWYRVVIGLLLLVYLYLA